MIALDAFGGDRAPEEILAGALLAHRQGVPVLLVGNADTLRGKVPHGLTVVHAPEIVGMDESAATPLRKKPDSSIRRIFELVRDGQASAAVTCGHSGAAMASALHVLGSVPGVTRPPLATVVPRKDGGQLVLLDLGANVDCKADVLVQFAVLGDAYARAVLGVARPRVGLLANGEEKGKGNEQVRQAWQLLEQMGHREASLPGGSDAGLNFVGNIEPLSALRGECDVLVCDGFVGNVMLKTVEGTVEVVARILKEEILRRGSDRFAAWLLSGAWRRFRQRTTYDNVGGALLLGVNGIAVVGHGRADARAVASALRFAHGCVQASLLAQVKAQVGERLVNRG